jgi:trigger factor
MNLDTALEQMKPNAVKRIQSRLVLEAVVKAENLEVSEEDVKAEIVKMAETYKMDADKLAEIMSEEEKKQIQMDMAIEKAVELVTEAAKEV